MNLKRFLLAAFAVGIVLNIWDFVVHGTVLMNAYYSKLPDLFRQDAPAALLILGDFVFALVFVWVFARVYGSFGGGAKGGATYGFYAGIFLNFPAGIFMHLMFKGFPYPLSWIWMITGIIISVIVGSVAGLLYKDLRKA